MYSRDTFIGDGSTVSFPITMTLGYLDVSQLSVRVGDEVDGMGQPVYRDFTVDGAYLTVLGATPLAGQTVEIRREVRKDEKPITFVDAGSFTATNMNSMQLGMMYIMHEALDAEEEASATVEDMRDILEQTTTLHTEVLAAEQIVADNAMAVAEDTVAAEAAKEAAEVAQGASELARDAAQGFMHSASTANDNAQSAATAAAAYPAAAEAWATTPQDVEVEPGLYSARHYAAEAADIAEAIENLVGVVSIGGLQGIVTLDDLGLWTGAEIEAFADNYYTKAETYSKADVDTLLNAKADTATTLAGYGITDAYSKSEVYNPNLIINGGFQRWDYATSQTSSGYGSDNRWFNGHNGSTKTHSKQWDLTNSRNYSRTAVSSISGSSNYVFKQQRIENVAKLAGKTITLSFDAKADANKSIAIEAVQNFGSGGTPSSEVVGLGSQLVGLTTEWTRYEVTMDIPSISGKTIGTDGLHTTFTRIMFWLDAGSDYSTRTANLGQQSGTFDIANVKVEYGDVATEYCEYYGEWGGEQQACQRYVSPIYIYLTSHAAASGEFIGFSNQYLSQMRTIPSFSLNTTGTLVNVLSSVVNIEALSDTHFRLYYQSAGSGASTVLGRKYLALAEI